MLITRRSIVVGLASISAGCGSASTSSSGQVVSTGSNPSSTPSGTGPPGDGTAAPSAEPIAIGADPRWPLESWHSSPADFEDAWHDELAGLRISLRDAKRDTGAPGFLVTVVLTNAGKRPIGVYQRWNSWGAYQWRFAIVDASGRRVVAGNPQQEWTRNGPTASLIEPGKELATSAAVRIDQSQPFVAGVDVFVGGTNFAYPLRVRGIFDSRPGEQPFEARVGAGDKIVASTDLWSGAIATPWTEVR